MKTNTKKNSVASLWKWLEFKLKDISLKLDHILFRMMEDDPRIRNQESLDSREETADIVEETIDI